MPILTINPTYIDQSILRETHLDSIRDPIQTFFNTTKLDSVNVNLQDIVDNLSDTEAATLLNIRGLGLINQETTTQSVDFQSINTIYTNIEGIVAQASGKYIVMVSGFLRFKSGTNPTTALDSNITTRLRNTTSSVNIGPECVYRYSLDTSGGYNQISLEFPVPINFSYITDLLANDEITFQAKKGGENGSQFNAYNRVRVSIVRLLK